MSSSNRPSGLTAKKGLELLTFGTPNGHKVSIMLEELKDAYPSNKTLDYTFQSINIMENIQKEPWFTRLGPNGRIPVLVDHERGGFSVMEGAAILTYLSRWYDPEKKFTFGEQEDDLSRVEQWVAWQHGGLGPMQGQANHFYRLAKERIPYPTQRYVGETERLYGVLDKQLKGRDFIVGPGRGKFTIADVANYSWVNISLFSGVSLDGFPCLKEWWARLNARPAVQRGLHVPGEPFSTNDSWTKRLKEDEEAARKEKELKELCDKAKEQYGYKYASP